MLEIWGRKNSSNVIPVMWAVGELGLEHQRHNVGGSFGGDDTEAFLQMNPNGLIPTISDDGFVLWESMAITRYLARQYGMATLYPQEPRQAALAEQWMEWYKSSITPNLMPVFFNLVRTEKSEQSQAQIKQCTAATINYLRVLERHLQGRSYMLGDLFSMADIPLEAMMYKFFNLDIERLALPAIEAWYARLCERPAYQGHAMIPFGSSPQE
jgi:glutathione S-transferase